MITIITGTPGAGKTLFLLNLLLKETRPEKGKTRRPIYFHNVQDVDLNFFHGKQLDDPKTWHSLPEHSVIAFDEGQFAFPQRTKQEPPEYVKKFAVHRHKGFDIYIVTQDPMNLDVYIRRNCNRHFYIHRILGREAATVYEYDHYESKPQGFHEKLQAISKTPFRYPKKLYTRYKSATQHTVKKRTPIRLYFLPILAIAVVGLIWFAIHRLTNRTEIIDPGEDISQATQETGGNLFSSRTPAASGTPATSLAGYIRNFQPVVPGLLHSAPVYADLTQAQSFPKPMCIIYQEDKQSPENSSCSCYTQQMTRYETTDYNCRFWVRNGWFDFTKEDGRERGEDAGQAQAPGASPPVNYLK